MISLITTCDPERFYLLRPFVEHYRAYGVERFYINLHFEVTYPAEHHARYLAQANDILAPMQLAIHSVYSCPFDAMAIRRHHDGIQVSIGPRSPWIVAADLDEFHEFPDQLPALVRHMDKHGIDHVRGRFVDRMARNGLPEYQASQTLWQQFPLGTDMTRTILRGWSDKVMLYRSNLPLLPGHHAVRSGVPANSMPGTFAVHHFKWDSSVIPRLRRRLEDDWKRRCFWWVESEMGLAWIEGRAAMETFPGLRVFDFGDDRRADGGGPHSGNEIYLRHRRAMAAQEPTPAQIPMPSPR